MRRLLAPVICALAVAAAVPAAAAPVTTGRVATARFQLHPDDGATLDVEVTATSSSAGSRLEVGLERCLKGTCDYPVYYAGAVPPGAVQIDGKTAAGKLRAHVGGVELALDWSPLPPGRGEVQGGHGGGNDSDFAFTVERLDPAAVHVVLAGSGCRGSGAAGDEARIEVPEGSSGDTVPLRGLRLPALAPACQA
jgi:hypothetical protein